jgi:hypothetical protein
MEDARKIQVMRDQIVKWLDEPFLSATLVGALVRVSMERGYILAEVLSVEESNSQGWCALLFHNLIISFPQVICCFTVAEWKISILLHRIVTTATVNCDLFLF